ncbi:hypothetical protein MD484_g3095, partial [Candolleomyces efflorescens]
MPALRTRDTSRSLEVTTDAPAPPSLAIISPTPRAFAFPVSHNLSDSPYSSPSSSPFEPDRHTFTLHSNPTTVSIPSPPSPPLYAQPPYNRSFTPDSLRSSSPTPSHKRRKSSCSSDSSERRPKKGDEDYIKRPENAFILFRRKCCEDRQQAAEEAAQMADGPLKKQRQADLSKTISQQWKSLGSEERAYWENLAKEKKKEHEQMYPNYVYRPQRSKDKDGRSKKKSTSKHRREENEQTVSFVVPVGPRQHHGRSASAPTPPPYQAIKIPQVYHLAPGSAPTSPSLLPMISKQSTQNSEHSNGFDFLPTTSYVPPAFATGGHMDPIYTSPEFLRGMFTVPGQVRKSGPSPLQQIAMSQENGPTPSPLSLITPPSSGSVSSGSSSPASPSTIGPFTPSSAPLPHSFLAMPSHDFDSLLENSSISSQSQAELDLQAEMQLQHDFSQFTWGWSNTPSTLDNNWDVNSIPSALLGEQPGMGMNPKFSVDDHLGSTGLEFGTDFAQALEASYSDPTLIAGYDDILAGTAFTA